MLAPQVGSGCLDLCWVGCGRVDAVYAGVAGEGWQPWDYAAGWLFIEEAGGVVTQVKTHVDRGRVLEINIWVAHGACRDEILDIFGTGSIYCSTNVRRTMAVMPAAVERPVNVCSP